MHYLISPYNILCVVYMQHKSFCNFHSTIPSLTLKVYLFIFFLYSYVILCASFISCIHILLNRVRKFGWTDYERFEWTIIEPQRRIKVALIHNFCNQKVNKNYCRLTIFLFGFFCSCCGLLAEYYWLRLSILLKLFLFCAKIYVKSIGT